jgi:hypothetical protein
MKKKRRSLKRAIRATLDVDAAKKRVCDTIDRIRAEQAAGDMKRAYQLLVGVEEDLKACRDLPFLRAYRMLVALRGPNPEPAIRLLRSVLGIQDEPRD